MKRYNINSSIIQSINFQLVIPVDPIHCFDDIDNCETRNWVVPGETLFFFIRSSASILQLDAISFNIFLRKKQIKSRRSTLAASPTTDFRLTECFLEVCETKTLHKFETTNPFHLPNGDAIYPLSIKIPVSMVTPFVIEAYTPRKATPIAKAEMKPINPFNVSIKSQTTSVSYITQFDIDTTFRQQSIEKVFIESTDLEFDTKPPHNSLDYQSNIKVEKPCNLHCQVHPDERFSVVYSLLPLTELGAVALSNFVVNFSINWTYNNLKFTSIWCYDFTSLSLGIAMLLPPVTTKALQTTTVPLRITNMIEARKDIEIVFDGGSIQPIAQRIKLPAISTGESITLNVSFLPLNSGYHQLKFWAEENGNKIEPLFPTYIEVIE